MPRVFVSIGSNIDRESNIRKAIASLRERFGELLMSTVYESKAIGFDGGNFFNQVVCFDTSISADNLVSALHEIEHQSGRRRLSGKFSSRTVDLDLLLYGDLVAKTDNLHVPREEITEHAFVLGPLAEIASKERHPVTGQQFGELWEAFDKSTQEIWPANFSPLS